MKVKKIKHMSEVTKERKKLRHKETELIKKIREDLGIMKENLQPQNIGKKILNGFFNRKSGSKRSWMGVF